MGGGTSLWASPDYKRDPKEIFNPKIFYLAITIAFAGCFYGFDQGNIGSHPYLQQEYLEIRAQVDQEQEASKGRSYWIVINDIVGVRSNTRRFFLATTLFLFHKFTGTDSLNYFAPEIFTMIGVKGGSQALLTRGCRRLPLSISAIMQATSMLYIALYVRFGDPDSTKGTAAGGIVGIIWIYIYAFGWSFGWSVAPYDVAAEIFPSRIRSVSMSFCFFINWIVDYGITKATPSMMTNLGWGTFLLYAVLTYIGAVFVFFCMPELKGRSIESMDDLFEHSIWTMYKRAYPTEEDKIRHDVPDLVRDENMKGGEGIDGKDGANVQLRTLSRRKNDGKTWKGTQNTETCRSTQ